MYWTLSHRADRRALPLADRHYNRQKPGTPQFVPPGRCVVLLTEEADALWVSSWPLAKYTKHQWASAWACSCFRNESPVLSSKLIMQAVAATRHLWGEPPKLGMVTFIDKTKVRKKRDYGRCYRKAGWKPCGQTKGGLLALSLSFDAMPPPSAPKGLQLSFQNFRVIALNRDPFQSKAAGLAFVPDRYRNQDDLACDSLSAAGNKYYWLYIFVIAKIDLLRN